MDRSKIDVGCEINYCHENTSLVTYECVVENAEIRCKECTFATC